MVITNEFAEIHLNPAFIGQVTVSEVKAPARGNGALGGGKTINIIMRWGREISVGVNHADEALAVLRRELPWFENSAD